MKNAKKLLAVLLVMMMTLTLALPAFAADDTCTITIANASAGQTYQAYKVFKAIDNGDGTYSYYADAAVKALIDDDAPFTVSETLTDNGYAVVVNDDADDEDVLAWLSDNAESFAAEGSPVTPAAGSNIAELTVSKGFYYYITTTLGTKVTIDNAMNNVTLYDKNDVEPSIPEDDPEDPEGYGKVIVEDGEFVLETSAKIGDSVNYQIKFKATNYTGAGETAKKIVKYTITDTPDDVTIDASTVVVKVGTATVSVTPSIDSTTGVMTIVLPWVDATSGNSLYTSPIDVTVTYTATVDVEAIDGEATNALEITWEDEEGNEPTDPLEPEDEPVVKTYSNTVKKVDKNDNTKILDAEFKLYDALTGGNEIKLVACKSDDSLASGTDAIAYYRVAVGTTEEAAAVVIKAGDTIAIKGLDKATYYLEETIVPDGYNPPDERFAIVFGEGAEAVVVENANGIELPATGGMGTVLFITIGAIVVMAAGIVLTAKKRLYNEG